MKLIKFRIQNFRSVNDSGDIEVEKLTALVGRNESGKTNLLLALASLKPPGGIKPLLKIKDFPRSRRLQECKDKTPVVSSSWELTAAESAEIAKKLGGNQKITNVDIGRGYDAIHWVGLIGAQKPSVSATDVKSTLRKIQPLLSALTDTVADEAKKKNIVDAVANLVETNERLGDHDEWAKAFTIAAKAVRQRIGEASLLPEDAVDQALAEIEELANNISGYDTRHTAARALVANWLPTFIYMPEFPELHGHQNLEQFINHRGATPALKESEDNFEKLAKVELLPVLKTPS